MFKLDLEKAKEPEIKMPTSADHRKSKGEKERYKHLNAECQRIARRQTSCNVKPSGPWKASL